MLSQWRVYSKKLDKVISTSYNAPVDLFQGRVKVPTGGKEHYATSPRALGQSRLDSDTDGIVWKKETQDFFVAPIVWGFFSA